MNNKANPDKSHEDAENTIERAASEDTNPLTLLETEDALSAIPDEKPSRER
jgi:hypothetical protein